MDGVWGPRSGVGRWMGCGDLEAAWVGEWEWGPRSGVGRWMGVGT